MKIVGYSLATIGFVHIVKHIMHSKEGCCLCGWHKTKEEEKATGETVSHKIKVEDEKPTRETESQKMKGENEEQLGSRYGSNPIRY
jgi:hypothetical protein